MKKLSPKQASLVQGAGCRKYLRRYHRAINNDEGFVASANMMLYLDCVYN